MRFRRSSERKKIDPEESDIIENMDEDTSNDIKSTVNINREDLKKYNSTENSGGDKDQISRE